MKEKKNRQSIYICFNDSEEIYVFETKKKFPTHQQIPVTDVWRVFDDYLMAKMFYVFMALGANELFFPIAMHHGQRAL